MSNGLYRGAQALLDVLAGIWLIVSPFYWGISDVAQMWTSIILGSVVVIVGSLMFYEARGKRLNGFSFGWINVILGLGAISYPFYFGLTGRPGGQLHSSRGSDHPRGCCACIEELCGNQ